MHGRWGFFRERLEEGGLWEYAPFENLEDNIHAVRLYLQDSLPKLLHEFSQSDILLHFDVL